MKTVSCFDVYNIKSVCVIIGYSCKSLKHDMLNHPELLELNATLAFEATIWRKQPSAHDVFVIIGNPTKNDTCPRDILALVLL